MIVHFEIKVAAKTFKRFATFNNRQNFFFFFFSELCWGKAMVAYTMPQQRKKKERSERLRGEGDQIKFIDLGFERWQVVRFRKARGRQDVP